MLSGQKSKLSFENEYAGSTGNVIKSVLFGKADAGATFGSELEKEPDDIRDQIRTIFETPKMAPHPLSAHPRVPRSVREAVVKAILALSSKASGAELLKTVRLSSPVKADYAKDYRHLEEVDVKRLSNWGE